MEFSNTSSTYRRYIAGCEAHNDFFETQHYYSTNSAGFCSMMRTIYFWRPLVAFLRMFLMVLPVAGVIVAVYLYPAQVVTGIVAILVFLAAYFVCCKAAAALLRSLEERRALKEDSQVGLLGKWAKAAHDKVCPLVTFTHEEESGNV